MYLFAFCISRRRLLEILALLALLNLLRIENCAAETTVDSCGILRPRRSRLESLIVSSSNLEVDTTSADVYDGDASRYKRANAKAGFISYISTRGFEHIEINGYVYGKLPSASWALGVVVGTPQPTSSNGEVVFRLTEANVGDFETDGGSDQWRRFSLKIPLNKRCPRSIALILEGRATNNEFPGWGLQLSEVRLTQSWYHKCQAPCQFTASTCQIKDFTQIVDEARDLRDLYSASSNIKRDSVNPQLFSGDRSRFKRMNNTRGELVYASAGGIFSIDVEVYQYPPYNTRLTVVPYTSESCRPIVLTPKFTTSSGRKSGGWMHRIARFDLTQLPLCPTRVAIVMEGGDHGWELQVSRVTVGVARELDVNSALRSRETRGGQGTTDTVQGSWWKWMVALIGVIIVFLLIAFFVRHVALFFGDDVRTVYHVSHIQNFFRRPATVVGTPEHTKAMTEPIKPLKPNPPISITVPRKLTEV